jgi:hypothetical protein
MWIVMGICAVAGSIGVLVGLTAEWGVLTGAMRSGGSFDLVLVIEAALVAAIVVLLVGSTRAAHRR